MITSTLRSEEYPQSPSDLGTDATPALVVRAIYNGVLIGTRSSPRPSLSAGCGPAKIRA
jgi:hypothetical protein